MENIYIITLAHFMNGANISGGCKSVSIVRDGTTFSGGRICASWNMDTTNPSGNHNVTRTTFHCSWSTFTLGVFSQKDY